ncbi:MAG: hypothetical protein IPM82_06795 [Saprospiraceae bacterium]|nr:hypothetical protein [Saprospiraceae bacterium]
MMFKFFSLRQLAGAFYHWLILQKELYAELVRLALASIAILRFQPDVGEGIALKRLIFSWLGKYLDKQH